MSLNKPRIHTETVRLELKHIWTISGGSADFKENVLVHYERDGLAGIGEAAHLTVGEHTAEKTVQAIERLVPFYETVDPFAFAGLPDQARQIADATPPARAAVEMALLDWVGRKWKLPLYRLFGLDAGRAPATSFSIGLDTPEMMQRKVKEAGAYHIIKVKLGRPNDHEIIKTLRAVTDKPIRVDANEGWPDKETAIKKIEGLEKQNIEFVEQPLPRKMIEETGWLRERTRMPIVADESVFTAQDIPAVAGAFSGINIKLMKAGGMLEALRMFQVARALNLDTMLGCMIETSVAITAAVHLQSLARWVDLDGNLLLNCDPFQGATMNDGRWQPPDSPGLGVQAAPSRPH
ncbi:MAG: dipeptide epimerase [Verrucomicrobiota bacterium]|nr:dipeptide epimerase [Verrucomicrobiota bacterium]